jgi:hypothetical protein
MEICTIFDDACCEMSRRLEQYFIDFKSEDKASQICNHIVLMTGCFWYLLACQLGLNNKLPYPTFSY